MTTQVNVPTTRVDQFFTVDEARHDRWRALLSAARAWEAASRQQGTAADAKRSSVFATFADLRQWEDFFAYPGSALLGARINMYDRQSTEFPCSSAQMRSAKSALVRRLVRAIDDPAKQRIRRLLCELSDERLLAFGLTAQDIVQLRGNIERAKPQA